MKILHTADWHLGHLLHGYSRLEEHQYFLDWLLDYIVDEAVDVLIVAGDIFDTANPSAASWQQLYQFLGALAHRAPGTQAIFVAGNHDSPSKLNAPQQLLGHFNLHFIGSVPYDSQRQSELNRLLVPLKTREGELKGWALAVPFLRSSDLLLDANVEDSQQRWQLAIKQVYGELEQLALNLKKPGECLISVGHGHVVGGVISELSERHVMIGGQHALPIEVFPPSSDYLALGHLHKAQQIKAAFPVHYSGSPLALSTAERHYKHQIRLLEWGEDGLSSHEVAVPKLCHIVSIPAKAANLDTALAELSAMPEQQLAFEQQPYLEVKLKLDQPQAQVREKLLQAIEGKGLRLAKISITYPEQSEQQLFAKAGQELSTLSPQQVFELKYQQLFQQDPDAELQQAFATVLGQIEQGEAQ